MLLSLNHLPSLEVECSLILQPSSVSCHASNLLTVVIWDWVLHRGDGGIDTEFLDALVEFFFLL